MWWCLINIILLISLTIPVSKTLYIAEKEEKVSKSLDFNKFAGIWFETAVYGPLLIPSNLERWPSKLAYCPTWTFTADPGVPQEMNAFYYTTSVKNPHKLCFDGTVKSKSSRKMKDGKPRYKLYLDPLEREFVTSSGKIDVEWAVIDTDYNNYAFVYMVQHSVMLEPRESVIALKRRRDYSIDDQKVIAVMGRKADYYYNLNECEHVLLKGSGTLS